MLADLLLSTLRSFGEAAPIVAERVGFDYGRRLHAEASGQTAAVGEKTAAAVVETEAAEGGAPTAGAEAAESGGASAGDTGPITTAEELQEMDGWRSTWRTAFSASWPTGTRLSCVPSIAASSAGCSPTAIPAGPPSLIAQAPLTTQPSPAIRTKAVESGASPPAASVSFVTPGPPQARVTGPGPERRSGADRRPQA